MEKALIHFFRIGLPLEFTSANSEHNDNAPGDIVHKLGTDKLIFFRHGICMYNFPILFVFTDIEVCVKKTISNGLKYNHN